VLAKELKNDEAGRPESVIFAGFEVGSEVVSGMLDEILSVTIVCVG